MSVEQPEPDPVGQAAAVLMGAGRVGLGLGITLFTRPALERIGFKRPSGSTVALARLAGMRDVAIGAHALTAIGDRERLRESTLIGVLVDTSDALAFVTAIASRDRIDPTAMKNAPAGAAAAIAGVWILSRL